MKVYYYGGELYHHGVQGQKWGVRRYQNPDGTLTDEGRKRYIRQKVDNYMTTKESSKIAGISAATSALSVGMMFLTKYAAQKHGLLYLNMPLSFLLPAIAPIAGVTSIISSGVAAVSAYKYLKAKDIINKDVKKQGIKETREDKKRNKKELKEDYKSYNKSVNRSFDKEKALKSLTKYEDHEKISKIYDKERDDSRKEFFTKQEERELNRYKKRK